MRPTPRATRGAVTSPHHLASEAGLSVLRDGGNAIEACIAAAATVAVVYPHMNSIGGDAFWLIGDRDGGVRGIDASGRGGRGVTREAYLEQGLSQVPRRGPMSACTVAGTISGWARALAVSASWGGRLPLSRLLEDAIHYARNGVPVADDLARVTGTEDGDLLASPGFAEAFRRAGAGLAPGEVLFQKDLANSLETLGRNGLDDFYTGELAAALADGFAKTGMPLTAEDLGAHSCVDTDPISVETSAGTVYNLPPPTQGLASVMILGLYDRMVADTGESFDHHHRLIEAVKRSFIVRNREIGDPDHLRNEPATFLQSGYLDELARDIDPARAMPWTWPRNDGDTIWLATMDGEGRGVSFIQSLYFGFGSGVVVPGTGIVWQNRGAGFSMDPDSVSAIGPGRKPFHTLNPALARLSDGRLMVYGTRGADAQPQVQAQIFTRHAIHGMPLQQALDAPRWVQGRTQVHDDDFDLLVENRFDDALVDRLRKAGHVVQMTDAFDPSTGHAGALTWAPSGVIEGASDPRSDGSVAAF
ncbi:MAG: gamma-glutamyltransferase family protein [Rhodospirillales bacterium]